MDNLLLVLKDIVEIVVGLVRLGGFLAFVIVPAHKLLMVFADKWIYAVWYHDEVRPLMDEDERMQGLSKLAHKRLRLQAIRRARMTEDLLTFYNNNKWETPQ